MRFGFPISCLVCAVIALVAVPWTGTAIGTPGSEDGEIDDHPNWLGNWCNVMYNNDHDTEAWTAGNTLYNIYYSDGQGDENGYNRYIAEMVIPWIGIQMNGGSFVRYGHSEDTNVYNLYCVSYSINQYSINNPFFEMIMIYELDMNNDSTVDWQVYEKIATQAGQNGELIKIEMTFGTHPAWNLVSRVDIPFRIDPDVYDTNINNIYWPNAITTETSQAVVGGNPTVARTDVGNEHDIDIIANAQGWNPTTKRYYFLLQSDMEYSQDPSSYDDDENIEDNNVVIWYVQSYLNCQVNPPPDQQQWTGIYCDGFEA